jgi:hypothetical protein
MNEKMMFRGTLQLKKEIFENDKSKRDAIKLLLNSTIGESLGVFFRCKHCGLQLIVLFLLFLLEGIFLDSKEIEKS